MKGSELNLGERMMGRRLRDPEYGNNSMYYDYRMNQSAWEMNRRR